MAIPNDSTARKFYRAGRQRLDDAATLLRQQRDGGALYLAGYGVECGLKALLVERTPRSKRQAIVGSFRGSLAHDFAWLRRRYLEAGGTPFPPKLLASFARLDIWGVELRYNPRVPRADETQAFVRAADAVFRLDRRTNRMSTQIDDEIGAELTEALFRFEADGPGRSVAAYRSGPMAICVRVVSPDFASLSVEDRVLQVYSKYVEAVPRRGT